MSGTPPPQPEELQQAAREFAYALLNQQAVYHHHKEQTVYTVTALYLGAASWLIFSAPNWRGVQALLLAGFAFLVGVIGFIFVWWQLNKRRDAAAHVEAALNLASRWIVTKPTAGQLTPNAPGRPEDRKDPNFPPVVAAEIYEAQRSLARRLKWPDWSVRAVVAVFGVLAVGRILYFGFYSRQ